MAYRPQMEDFKKNVSQGRCIISDDTELKKTNLWIGTNVLATKYNPDYLSYDTAGCIFKSYNGFSKSYSGYGVMLSYNGEDFEIVPGGSVLKYTNNELAVEKCYTWDIAGIKLRRMCYQGNIAVMLVDAVTDYTPSGPYYFYAKKSKCKTLCSVYCMLFTEVL